MKRLKPLLILCALGTLASAALAQNPTNPAPNTRVRFRFATGGGLLVGDVVVELFDQEKPQTVQNFLNYVRRGAYPNTFLHRCVPGFVLQGGSFRTVNPRSAAPFDSYVPVPSFGPISNEFQVGPLRSNLFGTLAMAKLEGNPDSATSSWFFNLGDNSATFDSQNGGFTVFGQVVSGANVLGKFNTLSLSNGIINLTDIYGEAATNFTDLPVRYAVRNGYFPPPRFADLIHAQITLARSTDVTWPTVAITAPAPLARLSNDTVTITGTAKDDKGVSWIWYSWNGGEETNALGSNHWSATVELKPGTNSIGVQSVDTSGNRSLAQRRSFFRVVPSPLNLNVVGSGRVLGPTNGQILEVGRGYKLTAVPGSGQIFAGWTNASGELLSYSRTWPFLMESNLTLTAGFMPNPFPALKGTYRGLFYQPNSPGYRDSGLFTLTLNTNGRFSAVMLTRGGRFPFTGQINPSGIGCDDYWGCFQFFGPRTNYTWYGQLKFNLDFTNQAGLITGFVNGPGGWTADLNADRAAQNNPSPFAGRYTVVLPWGTNAPADGGGDGYGAVTVDAAGMVTLAGKLADGTPLTQRVPVSQTGRWPLYQSLYNGKGTFFGWVNFTNEDATDLSGQLTWVRPGKVPSNRFYPGGLTNSIAALGSTYAPTSPVIALDAAQVSFSGGNLASAFTNQVMISPDNRVTNQSPNKLTLTLNRLSGLFNGTVIVPGTTRTNTYRGVVLQKQLLGSGHFLGSDQSGQVLLGPRE